MLKKSDTVLIACLLSLAVILFFAFSLFAKSGSTVTVRQDGEIIYEGSLCVDTAIELSGNTVVIENGYAVMESADCKNQICIASGKISKKGETIVCLPNKVTVQIK